MKKIQFQLQCSVMRPPTRGPIASAIAETPAQIPIAMPRCRGGKVAVMIDSVAGFMSAAPAPCTTRAPISQPALVARPQSERGDREDDEADDEDPPAAEQVGELAAREHQDAEGERVAVDDPFELRDADVQVALDRRQRDVHDRVVEHDHEQAERDRPQRPPLPVLRVEDLRLHRASSKLVRTKLAVAQGARTLVAHG